MKTRHVFVTDTVDHATAAIAAARRAGIKDGDISLVADPSIEMQAVPDDLRNPENDFMPAAVRGALAGGSARLIGGLTRFVGPPNASNSPGLAAHTPRGRGVASWVTAVAESMGLE